MSWTLHGLLAASALPWAVIAAATPFAGVPQWPLWLRPGYEAAGDFKHVNGSACCNAAVNSQPALKGPPDCSFRCGEQEDCDAFVYTDAYHLCFLLKFQNRTAVAIAAASSAVEAEDHFGAILSKPAPGRVFGFVARASALKSPPSIRAGSWTRGSPKGQRSGGGAGKVAMQPLAIPHVTDEAIETKLRPIFEAFETGVRGSEVLSFPLDAGRRPFSNVEHWWGTAVISVILCMVVMLALRTLRKRCDANTSEVKLRNKESGLLVIVRSRTVGWPSEIRFQMRSASPLSKVMSTWCTHVGIPQDDVSFVRNGVVLVSETTPFSLGHRSIHGDFIIMAVPRNLSETSPLAGPEDLPNSASVQSALSCEVETPEKRMSRGEEDLQESTDKFEEMPRNLTIESPTSPAESFTSQCGKGPQNRIWDDILRARGVLPEEVISGS